MSTAPDRITVSYSELDTFRQCPMKWRWAYQQRWRKPETGGARRVGTDFHAVLEAHYLSLRDTQRSALDDETRLRYARSAVGRVLGEIEDADAWDLLNWMYDGYVEKYGIDENWRILEVECKDEIQLGTIWVPEPYAAPREVEVWVKTRIDLIVEDLEIGGTHIIDHKSGKNLSSGLELDLDAQFDIYTWLKRRQGMDVDGAIRNEARTQRNQADFPGYAGKSKPQTLDQRHQRLFLSRTDEELDWQAQDTLNLVQAMYSGMPLYSSPNPDICKWKCDFKDVHLMIRKGLDEQEMLEDFGFVQDFRRN